jgi:hypothetical protein
MFALSGKEHLGGDLNTLDGVSLSGRSCDRWND